MPGEAAELPVFRSHLPAAWSKYVDVSLVVIPDSTAPFGLGVTFAGAREESGEAEGENFTGWVNVWGFGVHLKESLDIRDQMYRFIISQSGITVVS